MKKKSRRFKVSRLFLWLAFLGIVITGVVLVFMMPVSEDDFPHPLSGSMRQYHGAFSFLVLFMLGFMVSDHIVKKIRYYAWHWDGVIHLLLWLLLMVTGFFLYYPQEIISEEVNISLIHWSLGLILLGLFPAHIMRKSMIVWLKRHR